MQRAIRMDQSFYDELAESYHLIFQDWEESMTYQADVLARLLPGLSSDTTVLDCACGIGTQAIGLAMRGFRVEGSDPSPASISRAVREAAARKLSIVFRVDDMRILSTAGLNAYDAVIAFDNAIPHLHSDEEIMDALLSVCARLRSGGIILISFRDYGPLLARHPTGTPPALYRDGERRRIVHQVWDWLDDRRYVVHLFITCERDAGWETRHFTGRYRAVTSNEIAHFASQAGFKDLEVLSPEFTGYYQPILRGIAP
jgi:glycine/sarcosine N-methyltransferase